EIDTAIFPVIEVGLLSGADYAQLRDYARQFEKRLERVRGVARVERYGYREREVRVQVDPEAIDRYDIPLRGIVAAIQARNVRASGGSFESYTGDKNVVTLAEFATPMEVGDVIVRTSFDGPAIRVKDLARIEDGYEDVAVDSRMNGRAGISFLVYKKETADAVRTVDAVHALVDEERPYLPEAVEVAFSDDFSRYVRNRMRVVLSNGAIGLGLVLILLGTFLSIRSALWTALGIPVAILGTVFMLPLFGQVIDVVGMAAMVMAIGIVVDDAIIVAENIHRKRELGLAPLDAAAKGVAEVYRPVITTVLTTVVAFSPMFFMSGIMGKIVWVVPLVITLALLISLLEITVALPAHVIAGARKRGPDAERKVERGWFHAVRRFYRRTIFHVLRARYAVIAVSLALLVGGLWYAKARMDFVLFPSSAADLFYVRVELPRGTSLEATADKVREIEELVAALPQDEIESYVTRLGHQDMFMLGQSENWAIVAVYLTPATERERTADQMVAELREKTDQLEGYDRIIYYIDAGGPPVGSPVTLRVVGGDAERRTELADSVTAFLASIGGVSDIDRNDKLGKDQVEIDIDYERLSRLGLTVADVARTVRIAYDGEVVTSVRYGDEDVDFRVLLDDRARRNPTLLGGLLVPNDRMRMIPLREVARLRSGPGTASVYHYDNEGAIMITTDVQRDVITPLEVTRAVEARFDLTAGEWRGLRFVIGGEAEETQESMNSLVRAFT
ncbi:MAG: efflux RND transporter permease subunit, partial [Candidatus Krumholzibacteria bacterium]|nr:efflux RND transporter permease subunit [Candidatus Krumholzibacteria bacterium]